MAEFVVRETIKSLKPDDKLNRKVMMLNPLSLQNLIVLIRSDGSRGD